MYRNHTEIIQPTIVKKTTELLVSHTNTIYKNFPILLASGKDAVLSLKVLSILYYEVTIIYNDEVPRPWNISWILNTTIHCDDMYRLVATLRNKSKILPF